jgi:YegS/Rv2252/BmrU family lipid kinase
MEVNYYRNGPAIKTAPAVRRVHLIYNPTAGWRRYKRLASVVAALQRRGVVVTQQATTRRGDAESFARDAAGRGFDRLVVAGGDGTISEAVNGLSDPHLPLAIVPLGTANILAAEIGLVAHTEMVAATIADGRASPACAGMVNGRRFVMVAGIGFDAHTVARVMPRLKRWTGKFAYVVAGMSEFVRYRPTLYDVTIDGQSYRAAAVILANGHFYAGRFVFAPQADLSSPWLDVCLLARPGRWNLLRYAVAMIFGRLDRLPDVKVVPGRQIAVDGPPGDPIQADGDIVTQLPARISVIPDALMLVRPA